MQLHEFVWASIRRFNHFLLIDATIEVKLIAINLRTLKILTNLFLELQW